MISIEKTEDDAFILSCLTHPKIWPHVACDGIDSIAPPFVGVVFVEAKDEDERLGVYMLRAHNPALIEIHTALLPIAWGRRAGEAAKALLAFLAGCGFRKAFTVVPQDNPAAYRYATRAGLRPEGILSKSYPKGGVLIDQHILGIELCQQ